MSLKLQTNRAIPLLEDAHTRKYAVPAMCCYNTEGILATIRAAEAKRSPAMILLFPWAIEYAGGLLVQLAATAARQASVPITLHLDHAQSPDMVRRAADMAHGFDSIMIDMSHYERARNLELTRELAAYCASRGIATEAEPGRIEGGEDGIEDTADLEAVLTTPADALDFAETGIDWLAPAFGNVHGSYGPRGIVLEYDRLSSIREAVGDRVKLVLHGADPMTGEHFGRCIAEGGVAKVNINKVLNGPCTQVWAEWAGKRPLTAVIEEATERMQTAVEGCMDLLGSTGKADNMTASVPGRH
ncbi:fructose-bisphosphate aldolase [Phyllosticta citriasiana]|uniref:Fructose-bisphosphate aldolase n=1 Tax=Phyllosticta citriasiana TaxID=595635 RepID=A0ABR1KLE5_9PEZI